MHHKRIATGKGLEVVAALPAPRAGLQSVAEGKQTRRGVPGHVEIAGGAERKPVRHVVRTAKIGPVE
jgi:hypothetical protein